MPHVIGRLKGQQGTGLEKQDRAIISDRQMKREIISRTRLRLLSQQEDFW